MPARQRPTGPRNPPSTLTLLITSVSIIAMTLMVALLAQSMVRHHFFSGSRFLHHSDK